MAAKKKSKAAPAKKREKKKKGGSALPRSMWKGSISFGLVHIPVRLYSALSEKRVQFHMLHRKDKSRIRQQLMCIAENKPVKREDTVLGYELSPGRHVVVEKDELNQLQPKAERTIELMQFSDLKSIDPLYFSRPYYLGPEESARKAYALLVKALESTGKAAIARFVMREHAYLAVLRPVENILCLETLHYHDELRQASEFSISADDSAVSDKEVKTAMHLIDSMTEVFAPQSLTDDYRERVMELVEKKVQGKKVAVAPEAEEEGPEVVDLMEALQASLKQSQKKKKAA